MAEGLFKNYPTVKLVVKTLLNSVKDCKNSPEWEYVQGAGVPGHACGLPTLPTVEYLLDVYQQLQDVECSDPKQCRARHCDPYLSVFTTKWFCYPDIRTPNLNHWHTDQAFVSQFVKASAAKKYHT